MQKIFKRTYGSAGEVTWRLRALAAVLEDPGFDSQHSHRGSQLFVTQVLGDSVPSAAP